MRTSVAALMTAVSIAALASSAQALEMDYKPYVGVDYNFSDVSAEGLKPNYNSASVNLGTSYNRYFGTELFYQKSGKESNRVEGAKVTSSFDAFGLDLMGYLPLGCFDTWSLIGTAGVGEYHFNEKVVGISKGTDNGYGYRAGLGVQYNVNNDWSIRSMARYVNFDQLDHLDHMMEYSVGAKYNF